MNTQQQVKQLAIRLENATNTERIEALEELNTIAKQYPDVVGEFSLKKILDFLKQQGSSEEYQEALDLIYRLVKCKDKTTAKKNTDIISEENKNIELLLDLLGHEDSIISVTSSQILTEMHGNDRVTLEAQIQLCPDGINKLLLRLPDSSREEVRDQAIVLIQQLTASNDEIKKNVVFSEGFTILFDIIGSEGGANGAGLVVQDCLQICNNLLTDSGSCQRLFFEMGGVDLILKLAAFFDPLLLESKVQEEDGEITPWFQQNTRLACAVLAIAALYNSLLTPAKKFQMMTVNGASLAVPSMAFWIARKGPLQLVSASLSLLLRLLEDNKDVAKEFLDVSFIVSPAQLGRNIPHGTEPPTLHFSWRPSLEDERRMISLPAVLVERYIFSSDAWSADDGLQLSSKLVFNCAVGTDAASFSQGCLSVFEKILSGNPSNSDLLVQFILAAPPPDADMDGQQRQLETMKPLGSQVLNLLVEGCQKVIGSSSQQQYGGLSAQARVDMVVTERAANVLTLVFVYGSVLARELATVLTTQHTSLADLTSGNRPSALLPLLLASAGRAAKLPSGAGSSLLVAILRLLAAVVTGCERATKAMLEDPSNLFVVDLATTASESAGVPPLVQVSASFFLACAFDSFEEDKEGVSGAKETSGGDAGMLNKKSFLAMIDGRIGLTRFTELLKKPLVSSSRRGEGNAFSDLFVTAGFRAFYEERVEAVRSGIFSFYAGVTAGGSIDAAHQKMLDMQQERIAELEQRLSASGAKHLATDTGKVAALEQQVHSLQEELVAATEHLRAQHSAEQDAWLAREQELVAHNAALVSAQETFTTREQELVSANATLTVDCQKMWTQLNDSEAARRVDVAKAVELEEKLLSLQVAHTQLQERAGAAELLNREVNAQLQQLRTSQGGSSEEMLALKQTIVSDSEEKKRLQDLLTQRDRKIELLQGELAELYAKNDTSGLDRKISELEGRNAELKQQLWDVESQLQSARSEVQNQTVAPSADGNEAEEVLERLSQAATQLVYNLGVEVEGMDSIQMRLLDTQLAASRRCDLVDFMLAQVSEAVLAAVNDCSDLSEGVRIYNLQGKEGSVERFVDCCRQLSGAVRDLSEKAEECDALRDQLEAAERLAESLRDQMDPVEGAVEALKEQLGVEEQAVEALRDQLVVAQRSVEEQRAAASSLEEDLSALRDDKARMQTELDALVDQQVALTERERSAAAECERLQAQLRNHTSTGQTEDLLRSQIDELTKVNSDLDRQMSALTTQNLSIAGLTEEIATLNELLRQSKVDFEAERESLVNHLQQTQHDQQAVELQLRETAAVVSSLTASNTEQQTEIDLLRRQLHAASISHREAAAEQHLQQIAALQREKAEEVAALTRQIGVLSEQQAVAQQTIEELQAAREQSDVRCAEALERVSDLESGLDQRQSVVNSLEQRVEFLSQLAQSHSDAVTDLEARLREAAAVSKTSEATIAALNQEVQHLTAALNIAEAATGELLAKQNELFGENAALLDSKTKLAEYQKQVNQLNVVIADFDARLQHESKASEAALLAEKSASTSLLDKVAEQQVHATQLQIELSESVSLVQSLQTQLIAAGEQLERVIGDRSLLEDEVSRRTIASVAMTTELEEARAALQTKDQELVAQREAFDRERQALEDHNKLMVSMDPFQSQDKELRRLSGIADKLAKDLFGKESELKAVLLQLRRREGEMAGVKVTIEALHADLETARNENESLLTRAGADARQLKELSREISALEAAVQLERGEAEGLRAQLQSEKVKAQFAETVETQHSELMARVEMKLRELMSSSNAVPVPSGVGAVELVDHLRSHVETASAQLSARIQTLSEALEVKERQLVEEIQKAAVAAASAAAAIAAANSATVSAVSAHSSNNAVTLFDRNITNMTTPSKKTSGSANKSIDLSNGMLTPIHSHETSLSRNTHGELTVTRSGRNGHGKSNALTVSPGAKEAARLNAEVLRERRKLNTLQEQHSDLLGLLAQQEVELKVFRKTLETRLGQTELHDAEGEAQEQVIHMYGSYTNFRHYDLLD